MKLFQYFLLTLLIWSSSMMTVQAERMEKAPKSIESLDVIEHL